MFFLMLVTIRLGNLFVVPFGNEGPPFFSSARDIRQSLRFHRLGTGAEGVNLSSEVPYGHVFFLLRKTDPIGRNVNSTTAVRANYF